MFYENLGYKKINAVCKIMQHNISTNTVNEWPCEIYTNGLVIAVEENKERDYELFVNIQDVINVFVEIKFAPNLELPEFKLEVKINYEETYYCLEENQQYNDLKTLIYYTKFIENLGMADKIEVTEYNKHKLKI